MSKFFQKFKRREDFPDTFYEARIILILKTGEIITRKVN